MHAPFLNRFAVIAALIVFLAGGAVTSPAAAEEADGSSGPTIADIQGPLFITDVGQGNTARMVEMMLRRLGDWEMKRDDTAKVEALGEEYRTLVIGVGGSTKGLGAAGLDISSEMERTRALLEKAKEMEIPVVGVHIGGEPRRGELSDPFNELVCEHSTAFIVYAGGNQDGFFTEIAEEHELHLVEVEQKPQTGEALAELLRKAAGEE